MDRIIADLIPGTSTSQHPLEFAMLGATSKVMAVLLTYPYTVLRSRLQVGLRIRAWAEHELKLSMSIENTPKVYGRYVKMYMHCTSIWMHRIIRVHV